MRCRGSDGSPKRSTATIARSRDRAIARKPDHALAWSNRGTALQKLGRLEEALTSFDRAAALRPENLDGHYRPANVLHALGRLPEVLASIDRAVALDPDSATAHIKRSNALRELRRPGEALESSDRAIALEPDSYWNESLCRLLIGDFKAGWKKYEWRRDGRCDAAPTPLAFPQPLWLGETDLRGRTILLHAEQGMGDTLQFVRYAPLVAGRGARVLLLVQATLRSLAGMDGDNTTGASAHARFTSAALSIRGSSSTGFRGYRFFDRLGRVMLAPRVPTPALHASLPPFVDLPRWISAGACSASRRTWSRSHSTNGCSGPIASVTRVNTR